MHVKHDQTNRWPLRKALWEHAGPTGLSVGVFTWAGLCFVRCAEAQREPEHGERQTSLRPEPAVVDSHHGRGNAE